MGQLAGRRVSLLALLLLLALLCAQSALAQQDDETEQYPNERFKRVSRASTRRRSRSTGFFHRQRPVAEPVDSTDGPVVHVEAPASPIPSPLPSPAAAATGNDTAAAPAEARNATTGGSIAEIIDQALIAEFDGDSKKIESEAGKEFNSTVENEEGKLETVVRISSKDRDKKPAEAEEPSAATASGSAPGTDGPPAGSSRSSYAGKAASGSSGGTAAGSAAAGEGEGGKVAGDADSKKESKEAPAPPPEAIEKFSRDVDRMIDSRDNEFVLSASKDGVATLMLDPVLIQDLTFLLAAAGAMGLAFEAIQQPVINGYLVAGAIVGPGGFALIKELVQVESLAQLGVLLLLFGLGRELSITKLQSVWPVALLGGGLQIIALMSMGGVLAALFAQDVQQGVFIGALLSMSSTSVVIKCLEATKTTNSPYGQITIGTLILQDCSVGLMFALMPAFGHHSSKDENSNAASYAVAQMVLRVLGKLSVSVITAAIIARTLLPSCLQLLLRHASQELVQLVVVSFCLMISWASGHLELSEELGAFAAGAMVAMAERRIAATAASGSTMGPHGSHGSMSANTPVVRLHGGSGSSSAVASPRSAAAAVAAAAAFGEKSGVNGSSGSHSNGSSSHHSGGHGSSGHGGSSGHHASGLGETIQSVQNVLTALFVASIGLIMSPRFLAHHAAVLLLGTVVVMVVKSSVVGLVVHAFGVPWHTSMAVGITMAHIGEFAFVLLSMANQLQLLPPQVYMLMLGVTAMSLLTTPMVIMATNKLLQKDKMARHLSAFKDALHNSQSEGALDLLLAMENGAHASHITTAQLTASAHAHGHGARRGRPTGNNSDDGSNI